jgi:hypothetical protein
MASDMATQGVNGTYAQQPYGAQEPAPTSVHSNTSGVNGTGTASETSQSTPSKDEVGWYFVEQYYTTLSRNPEKIHVSFFFT